MSMAETTPPPVPTGNQVHSYYHSRSLYAQLKEIAIRRRLSVSEVVSRILRSYVEQDGKRGK